MRQEARPNPSNGVKPCLLPIPLFSVKSKGGIQNTIGLRSDSASQPRATR